MHLLKSNKITNNRRTPEELVKPIDCLRCEFNIGFFSSLVSIITILAVLVLSVIHIATFQNNTLKYDYDVDWDHDSKLRIHIDMTVAMNCPCK